MVTVSVIHDAINHSVCKTWLTCLSMKVSITTLRQPTFLHQLHISALMYRFVSDMVLASLARQPDTRFIHFTVIDLVADHPVK